MNFFENKAKYAGFNQDQTERFMDLVVRADNRYSQDQIAKFAARLVLGGSPDRSDAKMFGLSNIVEAKSNAAKINPCVRCGGAGVGNWGSVRNGRCFKCGGTGVN